MKISYFHYLLPSDMALNHVREFARATRSLGHEISVHALNPEREEAPGPKGRGRRAAKQVLGRLVHEPNQIFRNALYIRRELAIVARDRPDIILSRASPLTAACVAVGRLTRLGVVLEVNSPFSEARLFQSDPYFNLPWVGDVIERIAVRGADALVVVSDALRHYLAQRNGLDLENITVSHNGVDTERFRPGIDGTAVRARWDLGCRPVVGFVGGLHPWRQPEVLLNVIERMKCLPDIRFLLVGHGEEWVAFERQLATLGLSDRVVLTGRVDHADMPRHLAAMDVALVPGSAFYMSPLKLFEYMACGVVPVAPRSPAIEEIVRDGETGCLFTPGKLDEIVGCLTHLLNEPLLRADIARAAAEDMQHRFTWVRCAARVMRTCERVLERTRSTARGAETPSRSLMGAPPALDDSARGLRD